MAFSEPKFSLPSSEHRRFAEGSWVVVVESGVHEAAATMEALRTLALDSERWCEGGKLKGWFRSVNLGERRWVVVVMGFEDGVVFVFDVDVNVGEDVQVEVELKVKEANEEERLGVLATMLRSDAVRAESPSSSDGGSTGVGRSDRGRLPRIVGRRG